MKDVPSKNVEKSHSAGGESSTSPDIQRSLLAEKDASKDNRDSEEGKGKKTVHEAALAEARKMVDTGKAAMSPEERQLDEHLREYFGASSDDEYDAKDIVRDNPAIEKSQALQREIDGLKATQIAMEHLPTEGNPSAPYTKYVIAKQELGAKISNLEKARQAEEEKIPKSHKEALEKSIETISAANRAHSERDREGDADLIRRLLGGS